MAQLRLLPTCFILAMVGEVETYLSAKCTSINAKCGSNPHLRNAPLPGVRRGKLKGGQERVDVDVRQFLRLVGLIWGVDGAGRVGGVQIEDQAVHVRWCPR